MELRERLKVGIEVERRQCAEMRELTLLTKIAKHCLEIVLVAKQKKNEAEVEGYRKDISQVKAKLGGIKEKLATTKKKLKGLIVYYMKQLDKVFGMGYQRCLKKHKIENNQSTEKEDARGKEDVVTDKNSPLPRVVAKIEEITEDVARTSEVAKDGIDNIAT